MMLQIASSVFNSRTMGSFLSTGSILFTSSIIYTVLHKKSRSYHQSRQVPSSIDNTSTLRFTNREQLPTLYDLGASVLFGPSGQFNGNRDEAVKQPQFSEPLISVEVDNFTYSDDEISEFNSLCGSGNVCMQHVFPHVLWQRSLLALLTHPHASKVVPFSLLGALHLRSYFEVVNEELLDRFLHNQQKDSEAKHVMIASLWGIVPSLNGKGTEIILTLELYLEDMNCRREIWRETLIWYSSHKSTSSATYFAQQIDEKYKQKCPDFANINKKEGKLTDNIFQTFGKETWRFGWLSGDVNPIHMSTPLAWILGQKGRIAHGAMIIGKTLSVLEETSAPSLSIIRNCFGVSLKGPIPCGSKVNVQLQSLKHDSEYDRVDIYAGKNDRPSICLRSFSS